MGFVVVAVLFVSLASAFGVAGYTDPVKVKPGESIDLAFRLQNAGSGGEDYLVEYKISAEEGIEVISLDNVTEYDLPFGNTGLRVNFRVIVPGNAELGKNYTVSAQFYTSPKNSGEGGPLGMRLGMGDRVVIHVADETDDASRITPALPAEVEKPRSGNRWIALVVLVVIAILIWAYVYYKNAQKRRMRK